MKLIRFLGQHLCENAIPKLASTAPHVKVYLAGCLKDPHEVALVTNEKAELVRGMECSQEEADTRMIYHCVKADETFSAQRVDGRIIIHCKDTDVLVLAIHYFPRLGSTSELWIKKIQAEGQNQAHSR